MVGVRVRVRVISWVMVRVRVRFRPVVQGLGWGRDRALVVVL